MLAIVGSGLPVVTFSNDLALLERGAFLLGITAGQVVAAILAYAARRGVRRIAIGGSPDTWGEQARAAAMISASSLGLSSYLLPAGELKQLGPAASSSEDALPDAVLMTSAADMLSMAPAAAAQGVQLLGSPLDLDLDPDELRVLDGAWLAAPDPARFAGFARTFEDRNGSPPGTIAGLAFDAVNIVQQVRLGGGLDRSGILAADGFRAVCGDVRFRDNGSAARALAILTVANGGLRTVAAAAMV